jgi:hypothetical protein
MLLTNKIANASKASTVSGTGVRDVSPYANMMSPSSLAKMPLRELLGSSGSRNLSLPFFRRLPVSLPVLVPAAALAVCLGLFWAGALLQQQSPNRVQRIPHPADHKCLRPAAAFVAFSLGLFCVCIHFLHQPSSETPSRILAKLGISASLLLIKVTRVYMIKI